MYYCYRKIFSLAFYDIIDITPSSNSDFVQSLPNDAVQDMKQSKTFPTPNVDNVDEMKNYIIDFIKVSLFSLFLMQIFCCFILKVSLFRQMNSVISWTRVI